MDARVKPGHDGARGEALPRSKHRRVCARLLQVNEVPMTHVRIAIDPGIMGGKPVIRGTRVPVETILRKLGAGMSAEAILADHPRLTHDDVLAAQSFAADYLADEDLVYG